MKEEIGPITCCECGMEFWVPQTWKDKRRQDHEHFYCPNGHSLVFKGLSESERLKRALAQTRAELDREINRRESANNRARTLKGHVTRLKNKTAG